MKEKERLDLYPAEVRSNDGYAHNYMLSQEIVYICKGTVCTES